MKKRGKKETESNYSLKIHHSHDLYCESLTACSLSIKAKLKWTRESTYIKLCKIVKLIFQLCHLRLHRDWARVKEKEKSIPRILENARVRIHWKLFLHYHSSCLMLPFLWGAGEKLRRGRRRKKMSWAEVLGHDRPKTRLNKKRWACFWCLEMYVCSNGDTRRFLQTGWFHSS